MINSRVGFDHFIFDELNTFAVTVKTTILCAKESAAINLFNNVTKLLNAACFGR